LTIEFAKLSDQFDRADNLHAERYADVQAQGRTTENMARALEIQMVRGFEDLALKSSSVLTEQAELRRLMHDNQDAIAQTFKIQNKPVDMAVLSDRIGAGVDERLAAGFGAIASSLDQSLDRLANGLMHFGDAQRVAIDKLDGITAHPLADEIRQLSKSLEAGLSAGFADLTRILDVIMAAQSVSAVHDHMMDAQGNSKSRDPFAGEQFNDLSQDMASQLDPRAILSAFRELRRDP
jgi:hypothetical protein